jgi:hypothetical protein
MSPTIDLFPGQIVLLLAVAWMSAFGANLALAVLPSMWLALGSPASVYHRPSASEVTLPHLPPLRPQL